jgi:hypothetical protein
MNLALRFAVVSFCLACCALHLVRLYLPTGAK